MIRVHPCFHSYPLSGPAYDPVWRFASERNLPVLAHTCAEGKGYDHPEHARRVAEEFPSFPLILAHAGGNRDGIHVPTPALTSLRDRR
jgi:predicted TIM-barrel fold metal-dependent hydrolase